MNTKHVCRKFNVMFANILSIVVILAMAFPMTTTAHAASKSPFLGQWQALDIDGGDIRLTIGGSPKDPFQITWTEEYFGFCDGKAGIARGTGWTNADDPYLLEANLHLTCFTTGAEIDFYPVWRYDSAKGWLTSRDDDYGGFVTTWHRPGVSLPLMWRHVIAHPDENWVEGMGFPEGTIVSLLIRDSEGDRLFIGAAEAFRPEWAPDDTTAQFFLDFDLKAGDHLWMSDGMVVRELIVTNLQITETKLADKTILGTADPGSEVIIEYSPPGSDPVMSSVFADQDGFWTADVPWLVPGLDGLASQADGDGDLTRLAFGIPQLVLYIHYEYPDVVEGSFELGHTVQVTVFGRDGNTKATATVETMEMPHWGGAPGFRVEQWDGMEGPPDIQPGDVVRAVVDDGLLTAEARIGEIAATIDLETNSITGTIDAPWAGDLVHILCMPWGAPGGAVDKETSVIPDGVSEFTCSWDSEWDIQPGEMVGVAYWGNDLHWVANVISNPYIWAFPEANQVFGYGWPVGSDVTLTINNEEIATVNVEGAPWDENDIMAYFDFGGIHDLVADDVVMLSGSGMERTHIVQNLTVTEVNMETNTVSGTADSGDTVHAWVHGFGHDVWLTVADGVWSAYFGSDEFHLQSGMCGRAEIRVEGNNSTNVDWCTPPKMDLRVNYGHDWVESFYEAGHAISIQVTDSEGNVKATAEVFTAPRDEWEGAEGFQTRPVDWSPEPPDLQPYDWVYAQVDNGATAQVQLGDIQGEVRFQEDSVTGTILAPWITDSVQVECLDWGSGQEPPFNTIQDGSILTDESESYSCSWEEWDVQPWQDIGVGYFTPDGHWVANVFRDERWMAFWTYTPDPSTGVFPEGEHLYTFEWAYTAPVPGNGISGPRTITVAEDSTPSYDGFALIGPWGLDYPGNFRPQLARTGSACEGVSVLRPDQPMRFVWGWVNDYSMTYEEALAHYTSFTIAVFWDFFSDGNTDGSATLATMSDLLRFTGRDARFEYLCTFTEH